jgi:NAD(P)-dependent dehydrogenase (short-subunit alcohol dehydrogenase family)
MSQSHNHTEKRLSFGEQVAIVTGAGRGIGREHARMLASRQARVVANDVDRDAASETVSLIVAEGGMAVVSADDLTTASGVASVITAAMEELGGLSIIVGNAGIFSQGDISQLDPDQLRKHLELDAVASFRLVQAAWPYLVERHYGRIVLTTSSAAFGSATEIAYGVGKASVIGLARSLAIAGMTSGIKVNAIAPFGFSRMTAANVNLTPNQLNARARVIPPELVAAGVTGLVHESCSVTGELFVCGGGRLARIMIMQATGYMNPHITPEDVVQRWDEVLDGSGLTPVGYSYDHATSICESLPGWFEATASPAGVDGP